MICDILVRKEPDHVILSVLAKDLETQLSIEILREYAQDDNVADDDELEMTR
jgi:hypothetical protein